MKVKITIPTTLSDIKLSQYQKWMELSEKHKDNIEYLNRAAVAIFCNVSDKIVGALTPKDFNEIIEHINKIFQTQPKHKPIIEHNGSKYGFIPKLDDITLDELADIDTNIRDWSMMQTVMAVLYRPIKSEYKGNYTIEDYDSDVAEPLDLSMDVVFGATGFFLNLWHDLKNYIQSSIMVEAELNPKLKQTLEKNGGGIKHSMHYLKEILDAFPKLENYERLLPYYFYVLKPIKQN